MVLKPVEIVSADSLVVARTDVNNAINSLTLPPAEENTPPTLRITVIKSPASTANFLDTALIESKLLSKNLTSSPVCLASLLNCLKSAIAPSVVSCILSKVAASVVCASTSKACLVLIALNPA